MRPPHIFLTLVLFPATAGLAQEPAPAEIPAGLSVARVFGDHMVLQRETPVKVWGWAEKGEAVPHG
jgi:sialate O-acetylesterase